MGHQKKQEQSPSRNIENVSGSILNLHKNQQISAGFWTI
jgi:hypothetical protein